MLFGNSKVILLLKRNSLEIYSKKSQGVESRLDFPPNYEKDQEILDLEKFEQLITNFLTKLDLKNRKVIIAISGENLFEKTLPLSDPKTEKAQVEKFFQEIPFDPQKIANIQIRTKNGLNLIATNRNLYEAIVHVLQQNQSEIEAVVPLSQFGVTSTTNLTKEDINKIVSNSKKLREANFLNKTSEKSGDKPEEKKQNTKDDQNKSKKSPILIGGIAIISIGLGILAYLLLKPQEINPNTIEQQSQPAIVTEESQGRQDETESTTSSQTQEIPKDQIKIQILNGTGVAGQASQVQNLLQDINYTQIEIGNAQNQDFEKTVVRVSSSISNNQKEEIKTELEKLFESVEFETNVEGESFDIIITTGQQ